jgi:AcrR family transcriptional regulator
LPRKRTELDRAEKSGQILQRAVELLRAGGYEELSINRIARDLGLARAAVYWYFPSHDDLFVAACAQVFSDAFADPPGQGGMADRIRWGVGRFAGIYEIYSALLRRAPADPAAADLLRAFDRGLCDRLTGVLAPHVPAGQVEDVVETVVIFVEGLLGRRFPAAERDRRLDAALRILLPGTR